ncbi:MAG: nucleotidyltransferase family protein, partial [Lachnospiraceae bacterium]|nr:nucleotidyltransferase family protein [Lachnospiraceae bacterium]
SRRETGADYCIVVMSSNFTQRGEPAIIDKFTRARMALECGADLVIELPIACSAASAEYFAHGGVSILDQLGVVTHLSFGSECGDVEVLTKFADILLEEPEEYLKDLKSCLKAGHSYPIARNRALMDYAPQLAQYKDVLSSPNNILGIEYIKALRKFGSNIQVHTIPRTGSNYHDRIFGEEFCSALAIREAILSQSHSEGNSKWPDIFTEDGPLLGKDSPSKNLVHQMPKKAGRILMESLRETPPITAEDFSHMLLYKLLMEKDEGYERYTDVTPDLSDRIKNMLENYEGYVSFCDLLKSKNMTYTRISRSLLHILLDEVKGDVAEFLLSGGVPYARVLGFRKDATPLLTEIKNKSKIPLITKLSDAQEILSPMAMAFLSGEMRRSSIYEMVASMKAGRKARDERQIPIVII